jgi:hypothetical protein
MPGFTDNDNSIANGIPARHISPETGSSGNATMTNKGETSEGVNESPDSIPAPAAGLEAPIDTGRDPEEQRSFAPSRRPAPYGSSSAPLATDEESPAQQIADGGDRIKRDDDEDGEDRLDP